MSEPLLNENEQERVNQEEREGESINEETNHSQDTELPQALPYGKKNSLSCYTPSSSFFPFFFVTRHLGESGNKGKEVMGIA